MTHSYHICLRCSGTGKKPGLLDADQQRPQCIHCEGTGTIRIPDEPKGPEQLDLFEVNQGDQGCTDVSTVNAGTSE